MPTCKSQLCTSLSNSTSAAPTWQVEIGQAGSVYTTEIGKYCDPELVVKYSQHPTASQELGSEVVVRVKVGLVFSGDQGTDQVKEELGEHPNSQQGELK